MNENHTTPIDLQASKVFWKSPWWAKAPEKERRTIAKAIEPLEYSVQIDYTKGPPIRDSAEQQPKDWRGTKIQWRNGECGRIIGFADSVDKPEFRRKQNGDRVKRMRKELFWWAVNDRGIFVRISSRNEGKKAQLWHVILPNDLAEARRAEAGTRQGG